MKVIEKYIKSIETDINCISPNFNNEDAINNALYFHMHVCSKVNFPHFRLEKGTT